MSELEEVHVVVHQLWCDIMSEHNNVGVVDGAMGVLLGVKRSDRE